VFLADVSIKRPVFITVIITALIVVGLLCYNGLTINDMPEADLPYVTVTIIQPGASPEQIETKIAKNVEDAIGEVSGLKHISTIINEGVCWVVAEFDLEKSPDVAAQEVRDKVNAIRGELPQDIEDPVITKLDITAKPILSLAVTGSVTHRELSQLVDDVIVKQLYSVNGVGSVDIYGKEEREIQIKLDKEKLAAYGLTTAEVVSSLKSDNLEIPGGKVTDGHREISLRTNGNIEKVEDFYDILVAKRSGSEIRVSDVGEVIDGHEEQDSLSFYQGREAIGIDVVKQSGANTVQVAEDVKKELARINDALPPNVKVDIVRDNSENIKDSVNEVMKTIIEGCFLAVIIVFLFLREWESTLISAISLPTSIITTFIALKVMGFSLNTMSLMALSLSVGLLIDDAIVVIENIVRHLHMGKPPLQAAKEATSEIGLAVLATTMSVVAVFLPIAMVSGVIGKYFIEFGLTIVFSMLVSLFVSFTLVPMMSSRMLKPGKKTGRTFIGRFLNWFNSKFDLLAERYSRFLSVVLRHRMLTLALAVVLFIGSITMIPLLGFSFIPSTDQGEIVADVQLDSGLTLQAAGQKAKEMEAVIKKYPEVRFAYTTVEKDSISIFIKLSDKKERSDDVKTIVAKMRNDLNKIAGIDLSINSTSSGPVQSKDVQYNILGDNYEQVQAFAFKAKRLLTQDPHARDVSISYKAGKPEAKLEIDRDKAADLGVNTAEAADALKTLFDGVVVGKYEDEKDRYDVRVSVKDEQRKSLDSLEGIYVTGTNNEMISLDQVTRKVFTTTSSTLNRYDRTKQIEISANVTGMSSASFLNKYLNILQKEMNIPQGVTVQTGGINDTMQEGFNSLVIALFIGILFIFLVMAAQFESYIDPIAIMFALPMALIGAVLGLFIAGSELSIMSLIGIILLMGLVAKNAILLIDFTKQKRKEGISRNNALVEAGLVRLRPILMTTLAMIFGMIPLATATGAGTEMRAPMAHAVIGGLITSTILTLFVVPVIYTLLDDAKEFVRKKKSSSAFLEKTGGIF